jgi:hypothetical protein
MDAGGLLADEQGAGDLPVSRCSRGHAINADAYTALARYTNQLDPLTPTCSYGSRVILERPTGYQAFIRTVVMRCS